MAIKGNEIIEDNHLANAIEQGEKYLALAKKMNTAVKKLGKSIREEFEKNDVETAEDFDKLAKGVEKVRKAKTQQEKINAKLVQSQSALITAYSAENKLIQNNRIVTQEANKEVKQQVKLNRAAEGSIVQLRINLSQLTKQYDGLSKVQRENQKVGGTLQSKVQTLRNEITALEKATGRGGRNVGFYSESFKKATGTIRNFASALGLIGGVRLVSNIFRDAIGVIKDFDSAVVNLGAISGFTENELGPLTDQAKELGATTRFTASQVANLQLELAKLGFTAREIEASAQPILNLSSALGADLAEAAALTGATLRAFNLDATEAARVTDVLTAAATKSATDFAFFNTALSTVAPVANAVGVDIEKTAALLSTLANAGIDASTSATGLRNIFLALAESGQTLPEALDQILNSTNQASTALDLFGKRGASLGVVLANNQQATADLNEELLNAAGTAQEVAGKQLNSLQGALDLLRSAWEGYILGAGEAGGVSEKIQKIIKFLADNLETILDTVILLTKAFIIYKTALIVATTVTKLYTRAQKGAEKGAKSFGKALKSIPLVQIVAIVATLIPLILDLVKSFSKVDDATKEFSASEKILQEVASETSQKLNEEQAALATVFQALKQTTAGTEERQKALDTVNAKYGITLQNLSDEERFVKQVDDAYKSLLGTLRERIRLEVVQDKLIGLLKQQLALEEQAAKLEETAIKRRGELDIQVTQIPKIDPDSGLPIFGEFETITPDVGIGVIPEEDLAKQTRGVIDVIQQQIDALLNDNGSVLEQLFLGGDAVEGKAPGKKPKEVIPKTQAEINRQIFKDVQIQNKLNLLALERQLRLEGRTREEIQIALAEQRLKNLETENDLALKLFGEFGDEFLKANSDLNKAFDEQEKEAFEKRKKRIEEEAKLRKQSFKDIRDQNAENLKIIEAQLLASGASESEIRRKLDEERLNGLKENAEKAAELFGIESKQFIDANLALQREIARQNKQIADDRKKAIDELKKGIQDIIKLIEDFTNKAIADADKRIDSTKEEIEVSRGRVSQLEELAKEGNITAKESIKAEEARQDALQGEVTELERKKARLLAINVALQFANLALEVGDTAAALAAGDKVNGIIGGIQGFKEGTEDTGKGGNVDKDGGFFALLHPHERVLSKDENSALGGITNKELVASSMRGQDQLMMDDAKRKIGAFENVGMLIALNGLGQKIDEGNKEVVKAIFEKPAYLGDDWDAREEALVHKIQYGNKIKRIIKHLGRT